MKKQLGVALVALLGFGSVGLASDHAKSYRLDVGESLVIAGKKYVCDETRPSKVESGVVYLTTSGKPHTEGQKTIRCGDGQDLWQRHAIIDVQQM